MDLGDYSFELPEGLIAQVPAPRREEARLMVVDRARRSIAHAGFPDLLNHLQDSPLVVMNDTRVLPAKLLGRIQTSGKPVELLLVQETTRATWLGLVQGLSRLKPGMVLEFGAENTGRLIAVFLGVQDGMGVFCLEAEGELEPLLESLGHPPLPHYIHREPGNPKFERLDRERYQTVFASRPGAIAAPTAGLHFSEDLLKQVQAKTDVVFLTLHVGVGTFQPVRTPTVEQHRMQKEYFQIPADAWNRILKARQAGRPVLAVGTTTTRALESVEFDEPREKAVSGWTDRFLYPGQTFKNVGRLLTNFHLPRSTLFLLVCAFAGKDLMARAYQQAIDARYRFFSYGDAMLIL